MLGLGLLLIVAVLIFAGFYGWARRRGLAASGPAAEGGHRKPRVSLLTEAVAYVGAILLLAGGIAAIGQRWRSIGDWGHVGAFIGAAVFFLLVGLVVRGVREPAMQRLTGVAWLLSVVGVAGATVSATHDVYHNPTRITVLAVGLAVTLYSAILWLIRRRAPQNVALFAGLVTVISGIILTAAGRSGSGLSIAFALALWGLGLAWAWLGWKDYVGPAWVTIPCGVTLALIAPSLAVGEHGWVFAIGIATGTAAMAASVPLRNTPLLALGTLAMFGYVTALVVRYFHESLGVPGALAITGVLLLALAVVSARMLRATRSPEAKGPGKEEPPHKDLPKAA